MVQEKQQKLTAKDIVSDPNQDHDSEDSGELQKIGNPGYDFTTRNNNNGDKKLFKASNKKKMQLSFENIVIKAMPK